jgi:hypothetical protein
MTHAKRQDSKKTGGRGAAGTVAAGLSHSQSERDEGASLESVSPAEKGGGAGVTLCYRRFACQPLDAENFVGSTKALTDALASAFREDIPDDSPEFVEIRHAQERVSSRDEEGTLIRIRLGF